MISALLGAAGAAGCGPEADDSSPASDTDPAAGDLPPEIRRAVDASLDYMDAQAARFGLAGRRDLALVHAFVDEQAMTHVRLQQMAGGVPVWGGEGIVHLGPDRSVSMVTDAFLPRIAVDTTPRLSADEAIARALSLQGGRPRLAAPPAGDLWVLRHEERDHLAWRIRLRIEDGTARPSLPVMFIDAHDGTLVWQYDNLQTGSGPSLYSGTLTFELTYYGESGALDESFSDALRYLANPHQASNKGYTADSDPDHYSERYTGTADNGGVHVNSRIANKTFHLLAMGGTHHRGGSMTGIGPDRAAAIWSRALTAYMTSSTTFARAGRATYDAAVELHGAGSPEASAVVTAWGLTGITVDLSPPATAITAPADGATIYAPTTIITASATDNVGVTSVQFLIDGAVIATDLFSPYGFSWNAAAAGPGPHTIASRAFDAAGNSAQSAPITITVDGVPPAVAITAPSPGATVANTVAVAATASDSGGIARVDLYVDGAFYASDTTYPYAYAWSSTAVGNGTHILTAKAYDRIGNSATSAAATVTVDNDYVPPAVALTAPAEGAVAAGIATIEASASDNVAVTRVDFYIGGALVGSDATAPYQFPWNTNLYPNGSYTLQVRAYDAMNNVATSAAVSVAITREAVPPTVAINAPAAGDTVAGTVTVAVDAADDVGVTRVELLVDGMVVMTDHAAPWQLPWNTLGTGNGAHSLAARAYDAANNATTSSAVSVTTANAGFTAYDPVLRVPRCAAAGSVCDTGDMVAGRAARGPEPNAPNTLGGTCPDGTDLPLAGFGSLDRLRVSTIDGLPFAAGKVVKVEATVSLPGAVLDLFYTTTPSAPVWTSIGGFVPSGSSGTVTFSKTFTLSPGAQHAIRGQLRSDTGAAPPCAASAYNDRDDLVFAAVDAPDAAPPTASITAPGAGATLRGTATVTAAAADDIGVTAVELYVDGAKLATDTVPPYSFSWSTTAAANGPHTLVARALDPSGKATDSAPVGVIVDNSVRPPVTSITWPVAGGTYNGIIDVTATASADVAMSAVELYVDGVLVDADSSSPYEFMWKSDRLPTGLHTLQTRARDIRGNASWSAPVPITLSDDAIPPATAISSPADLSTVSGTVRITGWAFDNVAISRVELTIDGQVVLSTTDGAYDYDWDTTVLANGVHGLRSIAWDTSNHEMVWTTWVTTSNLDLTPPVVPIVVGYPSNGIRNFWLKPIDLNGIALVELYVDGAKVGGCTYIPCALSWDTNLLPNGVYEVQARALDLAGNVGLSAPMALVVNNLDVRAPTTAIGSPLAGATIANTITVATLSTDFVGVTSVELLLDGNTLVIGAVTSPPWSSLPWSFTWSSRTVANGSHSLRTRARDAAGNTTLSAPITITVANGP